MALVKGNLIELAKAGKYNAIVHGCNCYHTMGAGIARQIAKEWPEAVIADMGTTRGDINKLGSYSYCMTTNAKGDDLFIFNAYTQFNYGNDGVYVHWESVEKALYDICQNMTLIMKGQGPVKLAIPAIGCGLAGGDINMLKAILAKFNGYIDLVIL